MCRDTLNPQSHCCWLLTVTVTAIPEPLTPRVPPAPRVSVPPVSSQSVSFRQIPKKTSLIFGVDCVVFLLYELTQRNSNLFHFLPRLYLFDDVAAGEQRKGKRKGIYNSAVTWMICYINTVGLYPCKLLLGVPVMNHSDAG